MLFKLSEILKVTDIYKLQCALFVHDYMHNKLPISFNDSFTKTANPNSRQSSNLFRHRPRTKFSSRLKFTVIWNSLSHDHHSITSRNIFKKTLKRSFLDNYTPVVDKIILAQIHCVLTVLLLIRIWHVYHLQLIYYCP